MYTATNPVLTLLVERTKKLEIGTGVPHNMGFKTLPSEKIALERESEGDLRELTTCVEVRTVFQGEDGSVHKGNVSN